MDREPKAGIAVEPIEDEVDQLPHGLPADLSNVGVGIVVLLLRQFDCRCEDALEVEASLGVGQIYVPQTSIVQIVQLPRRWELPAYLYMISEADGYDQISSPACLVRFGLSSPPISFSFLSLLLLFVVLIAVGRYQVLQLAESTAYISIVTSRGWQGGTRKVAMHKLIGVLFVVVVVVFVVVVVVMVDSARW